jgi:hypothetical protein
MTQLTALVQPAAAPLDLRLTGAPSGVAVRVRPLEADTGIGWGAAVRELGPHELALVLCYPFKPGSVLVVQLEKSRLRRTVLAEVVTATDLGDGSWLLRCALPRALDPDELQALL